MLQKNQNAIQTHICDSMQDLTLAWRFRPRRHLFEELGAHGVGAGAFVREQTLSLAVQCLQNPMHDTE